jgi:hypothetical protein
VLQPTRRVELAVDLGVRAERSFLAACLAAGAAGALELQKLDPDRLLTSAVLRRAARHLAGQAEAPLTGLPADDDELAHTVADLIDRAGRKSATRDEVEHARLLLELAWIDREIAHARAERAPGLADLAAQRQAIRGDIGRVVTEIERTI